MNKWTVWRSEWVRWSYKYKKNALVFVSVPKQCASLDTEKGTDGLKTSGDHRHITKLSVIDHGSTRRYNAYSAET